MKTGIYTKFTYTDKDLGDVLYINTPQACLFDLILYNSGNTKPLAEVSGEKFNKVYNLYKREYTYGEYPKPITPISLSKIKKSYIPFVKSMVFDFNLEFISVVVVGGIEIQKLRRSIYNVFIPIITHIKKSELVPLTKRFIVNNDEEIEGYINTDNSGFITREGAFFHKNYFSDKPNTPLKCIDDSKTHYVTIECSDKQVSFIIKDCMDCVKVEGPDMFFDITFSKDFCVYNEEFIKNYIDLINTLGFSRLELIGSKKNTLSYSIKASLASYPHIGFTKEYYTVRLHLDKPYSNYVSVILLRYLYWKEFEHFPKLITDSFEKTNDLWKSILEVNNINRSDQHWNIVPTREHKINMKKSLDAYKKDVNEYITGKGINFTDLLKQN